MRPMIQCDVEMCISSTLAPQQYSTLVDDTLRAYNSFV